MSKSAKQRKRERQRESRDLRKTPPAELLEAHLGDGFAFDGARFDLGDGVEYALVGFVGDVPDGLAELADELPKQIATAERPMTVALVRVNSQAAERLGASADG